eukprot:gene6248-4750_t
MHPWFPAMSALKARVFALLKKKAEFKVYKDWLEPAVLLTADSQLTVAFPGQHRHQSQIEADIKKMCKKTPEFMKMPGTKHTLCLLS